MNNNPQSTHIRKKIEELSPWFHNIHLPDGTQTAPDHFLGDFPRKKWQQLSPELPEDLTGRTALDIGCNAGFYSLELARRGAEVTAIDLDPVYLEQAQWVLEQYQLSDRVELKQMQVYDLAHEELKYDIVLFMGVFYHLRYPLLALDIVSGIVGDLMVFQTLSIPGDPGFTVKDDYPINQREQMLEHGWPKMAFVEKRFSNDPTNWWVPNTNAVEAMLRTCGMKPVATPAEEIWICREDPEYPAVSRSWNASEYHSATCRDWKRSYHQKVKRDESDYQSLNQGSLKDN